MLLQFVIYLGVIVYTLGSVFMVLFPPRNYALSGAKIRTFRSVTEDVKLIQFEDYLTIIRRFESYAQRDPEVVNIVYLTPRTAKNRSIVCVELRSDINSKKPGILIIGGLNGMVWSAPNAILELAEKLLYDTKYQTPFFNDYDWYLIPMANPDGYEFTKNISSRPPFDAMSWSTNKTARELARPSEWHKNLDREEQTECFGTNVNRNFAYHWQDDVHKAPPRCCQHYPGSHPFSTAEAQAIRAYVDNLGATVNLAMHLHASFVPKKEYILYPWRYARRQPSNYRTLQEIGEYAARQARMPDGRLYEVHQSSNDEQVAGTFSDYVAGVVGIDLVFILKPYHPIFPDQKNSSVPNVYVKQSIDSLLGLVRGWRSSTKQSTLSFFGKVVEF